MNLDLNISQKMSSGKSGFRNGPIAKVGKVHAVDGIYCPFSIIAFVEDLIEAHANSVDFGYKGRVWRSHCLLGTEK